MPCVRVTPPVKEFVPLERVVTPPVVLTFNAVVPVEPPLLITLLTVVPPDPDPLKVRVNGETSATLETVLETVSRLDELFAQFWLAPRRRGAVLNVAEPDPADIVIPEEPITKRGVVLPVTVTLPVLVTPSPNWIPATCRVPTIAG